MQLASPSAPEKPAPAFYRPELDALRFCAFLAVFATHTLPGAVEPYVAHHIPLFLARCLTNIGKAGSDGVVLFFMLSSFLITGLLLREHEKTGRINLKAFYLRRALRIWPLYFVFLGGSALLAWSLGWPALPREHIVGVLSFTDNWMTVLHGIAPQPAPTMILWSVSVEEQFYLVWPCLFLIAGLARLPRVLLAIMVLAQIIRVYAVLQGATEIQLWESTFSHIDSIAIGALLAFGYRHRMPALSGAARLILLAGSLALIVAARRLGSELIHFPVSMFGCAGILFAALGWNCGRSWPVRALIYLGKISFGLYVFHMTALWLFPSAPLAFCATVAAAALSYHFLEVPFLKLKEKLAVIKSRAP